MRYIIDAWLGDGAPRLGIRDADTGAVRLHWGFEAPMTRRRRITAPAGRYRICSRS